jgi:DNA-binding MarR family transcriptional regulator
MKVNEATKEKFVSAMYNMVRAIKNQTDECGKLCGGLSEKEMMLIIFVGQNQHVKMSDIADNIEAPMSTLTSIVDKLVDGEFLSRDHSGQDRRVINVSLGKIGKMAYKTIINQKKEIAQKILSQLSEKEQGVLIEYLNIVSSHVGKGGKK